MYKGPVFPDRIVAGVRTALTLIDVPVSLHIYLCVQVMTVVQSLVKDGTTVCATIHSPTSYCFDLFDSLTMLVRGSVVYFGPQGVCVSSYASCVYSVLHCLHVCMHIKAK